MTASTLISSYIAQGTSAGLAATVTVGTGVGAVQYETDTHGIRLWNGSSFDRYTFGGGGGSGTVTSIVAGSGLAGGTITATGTVSLGTVAAGSMLANTGTATAVPTATTGTAYFDKAFGTAQGSLLYRNASAWMTLAPGTAGQVLSTNGTASNPSWVAASGGGTVTSVVAGAGLAGGTITSSGIVSLTTIAVNNLLANTGTATAVPVATSLTTLFDAALAATQGHIIYRSASAWVTLGPGVNGQFLQTSGADANPAWASLDSTINNRLTPTVVSATTTNLTLANHNNRIVTLNTGATLSINWANTGDGFSCMVINNTTTDITPTLSNFTGTTITNAGTYTNIKAKGMVALVAMTPDGGTTKILRASGDLS